MAFSIAVDVMGGDFGPGSTLPATRLFLDRNMAFNIHLFGPISIIEPWVDCLPPLLKKRVQCFHAPEVIDNQLTPKEAIRRYKNSSMRLAIESVKNRVSSAVVSGGNTGALMALSKIILQTLPGIARPAIAKSLPVLSLDAPNRNIVMLDLGANVECTPENLFDFALLGDALFRSICPAVKNPVVKILNIGVEEKKGHQLVRDAADLIGRSDLCFEGFIEPTELYSGQADVIVTDGFTGNAVLKTTEGLAKIFKERLQHTFKQSIVQMFGGLFLKGAIKKNFADFDPTHHNGAFILGLNGVVIKSHGNATIQGFLRALDFAAEQVSHGMLNQIRKNFSSHLKTDEDIMSLQTDLH